MEKVIKCSSCGAGLDPEIGRSKIKCGYCGSTTRIITDGVGAQQVVYTKPARRARPWMAIVVISVASIFSIFSLFALVNEIVVASSFVKIEATIIEISEPISDSGDSSATYRYKYQYIFKDVEYQSWSKEAVSSRPILGEKVTIHVDPKNPDKSTEIDLFGSITGLVIGGVILTLGIVWLLKIRKTDKLRCEKQLS